MLRTWKKWKSFFGNSGFMTFLKFYISGKLKRGEKTESEIAKVEMKQAIRELAYMERQFMFAEKEFEPVAWQELKKAQARVNMLIEKRKGENR